MEGIKRDMITEVRRGADLLALIIPGSFRAEGIHFFTPADFSQQLAYMSHPAGHDIKPHVHNPAPREVHFTQEVLVIKKGKLQVDFYDSGKNYLESRILNAGDIILLASGGHGFRVLEDLEMYEIKQGPYAGDSDKTRFNPVLAEQIRLIG